MASTAPALVLAAHGSRDPASAATIRALAVRVGRVWRSPVVAAFLDFDEPSIPDALAALPEARATRMVRRAPGRARATRMVRRAPGRARATRMVRRGPDEDPAHGVPGGERGTVAAPAAASATAPVVVPMLLTSAYHGRVDLPGVLANVARPVRLAPVLGPDPLLVDALVRRLSDLEGLAGADGVALIAAGTSDSTARSTVDETAAALARRLGLSCVVGYGSAVGPTAGDAVLALRASGSRRIVVASYFLAPGLLYSATARSALLAGATGVAAPLGGTGELVRLVIARARGEAHAGAEDRPALQAV